MKCPQVLMLSVGTLLSLLVFAEVAPSAPATYFVDGRGGDGLAEGGLGAAAKEITNDIEGTPRPQGSAPDVGAYEFKAAQPK